MKLMKSITALIAVVIVGAGCATNRDCDTMSFSGPNALTLEEEIEMGETYAKQVEEEQQILNNPGVQDYVREIGERLAAQVDRTDVNYTFKVIDAPDTINAFALPGGFMYIYTGLMLQCENEAELAGVMGHEIAHVAAYHHGRSMTARSTLSGLMEVLVGGSGSPIAEGAASVGAALAGLKFSRNHEREADCLGMTYLVRAGYNPMAMVEFYDRVFNKAQQDVPEWTTILSTHPISKNRVLSLQEEATEHPPDVVEEYPKFRDRYMERALIHLQE